MSPGSQPAGHVAAGQQNLAFLTTVQVESEVHFLHYPQRVVSSQFHTHRVLFSLCLAANLRKIGDITAQKAQRLSQAEKKSPLGTKKRRARQGMTDFFFRTFGTKTDIPHAMTTSPARHPRTTPTGHPERTNLCPLPGKPVPPDGQTCAPDRADLCPIAATPVASAGRRTSPGRHTGRLLTLLAVAAMGLTACRPGSNRQPPRDATLGRQRGQHAHPAERKRVAGAAARGQTVRHGNEVRRRPVHRSPDLQRPHRDAQQPLTACKATRWCCCMTSHADISSWN